MVRPQFSRPPRSRSRPDQARRHSYVDPMAQSAASQRRLFRPSRFGGRVDLPRLRLRPIPRGRGQLHEVPVRGRHARSPATRRPMKALAALTVALLVSCAFASAALAAGTRADLDGVWLFYGAQVPEEPALTAAGREKLDQYDPLRDDTDTICKPVTFTNIMHTPSPPIEIRQHDDDVEIDYEFMDVHRRVLLEAECWRTRPYTVRGPPAHGALDRALRGRGASSRHGQDWRPAISTRSGSRACRNQRRCAPRSASPRPATASRSS